MEGYCERHKQAYEIKRLPGGWVYECSECRKEGRYDTNATTTAKMNPADEWLAGNCCVRIIDTKE
jgi:hypothetical protein